MMCTSSCPSDSTLTNPILTRNQMHWSINVYQVQYGFHFDK